ncbi:MAG: glycosyltransferase 61 family protein [Muribaculum sp.]|nr:glycosyltransferase 61 family protein [Muribaculum sp.]
MSRFWPFAYDFKPEDYDRIIFFTDDKVDRLTDNYLEMFKLLGIEDKVTILHAPAIAEELSVADPSFEHDTFISQQIKDLYAFIRRKGLEAVPHGKSYPRKILLTRSSLPDATKDEVNIKTMDHMFEQAGYQIISPEKTKLTDLIAMMHYCESVASYSGSTAHNFILGNPDSGCHFSIMERNPHRVTFQISSDKFMGISPDYVDASFMPRMATSQGRVVLFGLTDQLKDFASDYGLNIGIFKQSTRQLRKDLLRYLSRYRRYYGEAESIEPWEIETAPLFAEAVIDTNNHYSLWLIEHLPLSWYDWLTPRFIARFIRHIILRH